MSQSLLGRVRKVLEQWIASIGYLALPVLLATPFLVFLYLRAVLPPPVAETTAELDVIYAQAWRDLPVDYVSLLWFALFSVVTFFGAVGSTVSFFSRHESPESSAKKSRTLLGAQVFGAVFATILFATFVGGLVQGSLFPDIKATYWHDIGIRLEGWAKLMVWSFIAGFSERFVPDLLDNLIQRGGKDDASR